jgi:CBS domain-containing protein
MKIEQLMTKEVVSCQPDDSLDHAARIMLEKDCGFVPVTDSGESRRIAGVVTDRDICMAACMRGEPLPQIPVGEVMSTGIRTCKPSDDLETAESTLREAQVHRLPVVDDADQLLGVISLADIAREAAREAGLTQHMVTAAEVGTTLVGIRQPRVIEASN